MSMDEMEYPEAHVITNASIFIEKQLLLDVSEFIDSKQIEKRSSGMFKDKSFFLNAVYDWVIVKDDLSQLVLVPLRKE